MDQTFPKQDAVHLFGLGHHFEKRKIAIGSGDSFANGGNQEPRIRCGTQFKVNAVVDVRQIHRGLDGAAQVGIFGVADDSDDRIAGLEAAGVRAVIGNANVFADRILPGEIFLCE